MGGLGLGLGLFLGSPSLLSLDIDLICLHTLLHTWSVRPNMAQDLPCYFIDVDLVSLHTPLKEGCVIYKGKGALGPELLVLPFIDVDIGGLHIPLKEGSVT